MFGSCPDVWFTVKERLVHATGETAYNKGDGCRDLREDREVTVHGTTQTYNGHDYVLAKTIDIKK